jgi:hypothetical protein
MTSASTDVGRSPTPDYETLRQIAQSLSIGLAVVDRDDFSIAFENANSFKWFPPGVEEDERIPARLPGFSENCRVHDSSSVSR